MEQDETRTCFLDKSRSCPSESLPMCRAWDGSIKECIIINQLRASAFKDGAVTMYPVSAPPPEVR